MFHGDAEQQDCNVYCENVYMRYFKRVIKFFQGFHILKKETTNELPKKKKSHVPQSILVKSLTLQ